jgi:hypothetical protein
VTGLDTTVMNRDGVVVLDGTVLVWRGPRRGGGLAEGAARCLGRSGQPFSSRACIVSARTWASSSGSSARERP